MAFRPYPTDFPSEALTAMAAAFRDHTKLAHGAHGAEEVLAYGLGIALPEKPMMASLPTDDEGCAKACEDCCKSHAGGGMKAFPMGLLLQLAMTLIQRYLSKS